MFDDMTRLGMFVRMKWEKVVLAVADKGEQLLTRRKREAPAPVVNVA